MTVLKDNINEAYTIVEANDGELPQGVLMRVVHPICSIGQPNRNNRVYERALWDNVLSNEEVNEKMENRRLFGLAEHPDTSQGTLEKVSHVITKTWIDESDNRVYQEIDLLDTPYGRIIETLLKADCGVGVSTRADGELEEVVNEDKSTYNRVVSESFSYISTDYTIDPSTFNVLPVSVKQNMANTVNTALRNEKIDKGFATAILESVQVDEEKIEEEETQSSLKALAKAAHPHTAEDFKVATNGKGQYYLGMKKPTGIGGGPSLFQSTSEASVKELLASWIAWEDINEAKLTELVPFDKYEDMQDAKINQMDREDVVSVLEDAGIACSDDDDELRQVLRANIEDGTIDASVLESVKIDEESIKYSVYDKEGEVVSGPYDTEEEAKKFVAVSHDSGLKVMPKLAEKTMKKDKVKESTEDKKDKVVEGKDARGVRDGSGPYKDSAEKGKGKRKEAGEKCPVKNESKDNCDLQCKDCSNKFSESDLGATMECPECGSKQCGVVEAKVEELIKLAPDELGAGKKDAPVEDAPEVEPTDDDLEAIEQGKEEPDVFTDPDAEVEEGKLPDVTADETKQKKDLLEKDDEVEDDVPAEEAPEDDAPAEEVPEDDAPAEEAPDAELTDDDIADIEASEDLPEDEEDDVSTTPAEAEDVSPEDVGNVIQSILSLHQSVINSTDYTEEQVNTFDTTLNAFKNAVDPDKSLSVEAALKSYDVVTANRMLKALQAISDCNSNTYESIKEHKDITIKEASIRAEYDKSIEMLEAVTKIDEKHVALLNKQKKANINMKNESAVLFGKLEEKNSRIKEIQEKLQQTLDEQAQRIEQLHIEKKKAVIEAYVEAVINCRNYKFTDNLKALLKECQSFEDVDEMIESAVAVIRKELRHSCDITEIQISVPKTQSSEISEKINFLLS